MPTFLITWRPSGEIDGRGWSESNIRKLVKRLNKNGTVTEPWPFWSYRLAEEGNRVFLVRQGKQGHALFGYGHIARIPEPYTGSADICFEALTVPSVDVLARKEYLHKLTQARKIWGARASGIPLPGRVAAALETLITNRQQLPVRSIRSGAFNGADDSIDDLSAVYYGALGHDGAERAPRVTSGVKRDPRVRKAVLRRGNGACERDGCGIGKAYSGFLDVHHILGAEKSDRVWNCVAICPNCHREAHAAPGRDRINARLLSFARKFKPPRRLRNR